MEPSRRPPDAVRRRTPAAVPLPVETETEEPLWLSARHRFLDPADASRVLEIDVVATTQKRWEERPEPGLADWSVVGVVGRFVLAARLLGSCGGALVPADGPAVTDT